MKPLNKKIISAAVLLLWMGVIFWFSSQNGEESGAMSEGIISWFLSLFHIPPEMPLAAILHYLLRKAAHFTEYLILSLFVMNLCGQFSWKKPGRILAAVLFAAIYATTDEWHQSFVVGRVMSFTDVCIDTFGALIGAVSYHLTERSRHNGHNL